MLGDLRVAARLRGPWEAVDLGVALLRASARHAYPAFLSLALPLAAALAFIFRDHPWWAPLVFWWLLPLVDRPLLHVLAKAAFQEPPGLLATWRELPGGLRHGLAAQLLWRRLDFTRCLLLPVWQLEGPGGSAFRARRRVLLKRGRAQAALLSLVCAIFTYALSGAVVALLGYLWPQGDYNILEAVFADAGSRSRAAERALAALPMLAMLLVEPLHVAGGFGLYLNRRVQLEGWDLERAFRSLGARASKLGRALALLAALALAHPGLRGEPPPPAQPDSRPKAVLKEVLAAPEFSTREDAWRLRRRNPVKEEPRSLHLPGWVAVLGRWAGLLLKALIPLALLGALAWFLWRRAPALRSSLEDREALPPPGRLFGLDLRPESLPADPAAAAESLWAAGNIGGALSLLYRATLVHLVRERGLALGPGATEGECLVRARAILDPEPLGVLARLMAAWGALAYGGRAPLPGDRELCGLWARHFGGRP